jgi:hypothetical protein
MRFEGLTVSAKTVLCRLADECKDNGFNAHPSREAIAEDCMMSVASVKRALRWLRDVDLIRVDGSASGGRGHTTRYWINVPLIREHQKERFADRVAEDEPPPPQERGSHRPPLAEEKGVTGELKGVKSGLKGVTAVTHYPYTHIPKSARDGQSPGKASPSARSPSPASVRAGQTSRPEAKPKSGADRRLVGDGLANDGLGGVPVPDCPEAARRWANLRRAIWSKQVEALFRTWLPASAIRALRVAADGAGVLELGGFAAKRVAGRPEIGAFLAEQGWRVEVSGAGG